VRPQDTFTIHSARLRMEDVTPEALRAMNEQTERATTELADLRPDVVATACLVAIMAQSPGSHRAAQAEIESILEREHASAPVVSSAGAVVDALHELGARKIGIVAPYLEELTQLVVAYTRTRDEVAEGSALEVPDNRAVAALDPHDLEEHWRRSTRAGATRSSFGLRPDALARGAERWSAAASCRRWAATATDVLRALDLEPMFRAPSPCCTRARRPSPDRKSGKPFRAHSPGTQPGGLTHVGHLVPMPELVRGVAQSNAAQTRFAPRSVRDYSRVTYWR
jgi:hypothetical protein